MRWPLLCLLLSAGCTIPEDDRVASQHREQMQQVYAEAERVMKLVNTAQDGCQAIRQFPEAYWLMRGFELEVTPRALTLILLEKEEAR